jgi:Tol biopolymer transport system component
MPREWLPPSNAFCPRISPDGQMLAFLTLVNGLSQVAVMKADGSLILSSAASHGYYQLQRFRPQTGREDLLPIFFDPTIKFPSATVFPDGKEIAAYGMYGVTPEKAGVARLYALDLNSKKARPLESAAETWRPVVRDLASAPDGKSVLTAVQIEDVLQIVKIPRDGSLRREPLFSLPSIWSYHPAKRR